MTLHRLPLLFAFCLLMTPAQFACGQIAPHTEYSCIYIEKDWFTETEKKIREISRLDKIKVTKPVSCAFKLSRKGEIIQLRILRSSHQKSSDSKALEILRKAVPYKTLPSELWTFVTEFNSNTDIVVRYAKSDELIDKKADN